MRLAGRSIVFAFLIALVAASASAHLVVDVKLSVTAPAFVPIRQPFSYRIVADVLANDEAVDVVVTTTLPASVGYVGASGEGWSCGELSHVVTCSSEEIEAGPNILTLDVTAPSTPGPIVTNVSIASLGSVDLNARNDSDSASSFAYDPAVCPAASIQILQPADGASLLASPARLSWTAVPNARAYEVYAAVEGERTARVATTSETPVTVPFPRGSVAWHVDALFSSCPTISSAPRTFVSVGQPETLAITTLAGAPNRPGSVDGPASQASFQAPAGLALDHAGNLFVADATDFTIREISGGTVTTPSGTSSLAGSEDGRPASFASPMGLAISPADDFLFIADPLNQTLRMRYPGDRALGYVITIGGARGEAGAVDGLAEVSRLSSPAAVAVNPRGTLYVADSGNHRIRSLTTVPDYIGYYSTSTLAGGSAGSADGPLESAQFRSPAGIAVDGETIVYVADTGNHTIRKIENGIVTTLAGLAGIPGSSDGHGADARFKGPSAIAVDALGNLYVCDTGNQTIRKVAPSGLVTTVAGLDANGGLSHPGGITIAASGAIYISDTGNHRVVIAHVVAPLIRQRPSKP
jgi:sugar lactone lactonase YvrE